MWSSKAALTDTTGLPESGEGGRARPLGPRPPPSRGNGAQGPASGRRSVCALPRGCPHWSTCSSFLEGGGHPLLRCPARRPPVRLWAAGARGEGRRRHQLPGCRERPSTCSQVPHTQLCAPTLQAAHGARSPARLEATVLLFTRGVRDLSQRGGHPLRGGPGPDACVCSVPSYRAAE